MSAEREVQMYLFCSAFNFKYIYLPCTEERQERALTCSYKRGTAFVRCSPCTSFREAKRARVLTSSRPQFAIIKISVRLALALKRQQLRTRHLRLVNRSSCFACNPCTARFREMFGAQWVMSRSCAELGERSTPQTENQCNYGTIGAV